MHRDTQGRFILGPRLAELAVAAGEDRLLAIAQPVLAQLRDLTGESASLFRRQGTSGSAWPPPSAPAACATRSRSAPRSR